MSDNIKNKSLENIEKGMLEAYINNPALAREELEAAGFNVNSLVDDGLALIKQYHFRKQVELNKANMGSLFAKAVGLLSAKAKINKPDALAILQKYQVNVQYRNLTNFSEEELNDILKDVDIIKLIEELEKNPN
jgi:hypothetical protein